MKKILLVAVALSLALTAKVFADEAKKAQEVKPTTTAAAPATPTAKPATTETALKGNVTKLEGTKICVKDNAGKEWTFNVCTVNVKDYKVGDNVEVKYEKENLKSIAKAMK